MHAKPPSWRWSRWASEPALLELHPLLAGGIQAREALELLDGVGADGPVLLVAHEPDLSGIVANSPVVAWT